MAHNGGKLQVNLNHPGGGGDFPFKNCLLDSSLWAIAGGGSSPDYSKYDDNGFMHTLDGLGVQKYYRIPPQADRPGHYVVRWDGGGTVQSGTITDGGTLTVETGAVTASGYTFSTTGDYMSLYVSAVAEAGVSYPHNIRVCHVDDSVELEAAIAAGRPWDFGTKFIEVLNEVKPYAIRFLNSVQNNAALITVAANRKPTSYHSYPDKYIKSSLVVGPTTNTGNAYSLAFTGFTKVHRATALFYWNASPTFEEPVTLNINSTGAVTVTDDYVNNNNGDEIQYEIRMPGTSYLGGVMYDSLLDKYIMLGGSGETLSAGLDVGWPIEVMMDLCRILGCHFSCPISRYAVDPPTDLVTTYCQLADIYLIPNGLKLLIEGPNEHWNSANGFRNYWYAKHREDARAVGASPAYETPTPQEWYGRVMSQVGAIMWDYFNDDTSKFDLIGAGQAYGGVSAYDACMTSARYVAENGDNTDLAAYNWYTEWDITGYYVSSYREEATETTAAASYAAASTDTQRLAVVNTYMSDQSGPWPLTALYARYAAWKAWIESFSLNIAFGQYEGGYSPDYTGTSEVNTFRAATKAWPGLYWMTMQNYMTFQNTYGGRYSSMYRLSGENAAWNVREPNIWVTPDPVQWTAAVHYSSTGQRRLRLNCS